MGLHSLQTEIVVLGWSVAYLLGHVLLQALSLDLSRDLSLKYLFGPRDEPRETTSVVAGRLKRALHNFLETYPAFIALALALVVADKAGGMGAVGAWIWLGARIAFLGLYVTGVPVLRSVAWFVSLIGLGLMLFRLMA